MTFKNTTIQNRSKQQRLKSSHTLPHHYFEGDHIAKFLTKIKNLNYDKETVLFSLGYKLIKNFISDNVNIQNFLAEYEIQIIDLPEVPVDEFDILGSAYQFLNSKLENLEKGSFYTGGDVALDFVRDLTFDNGEIIFDPACGSGSFLFRSNAGANQIYGVDSDPIAVMIAKFNYYLKFPDAPYPQIFCEDFFSWFSKNQDLRFDYVIGNPPYGANLDLALIPSNYVSSGESFSYFIEFSYWLLKQDGIFRFLLPEAILNVKRHTDIRKFILKYSNLARIKRYPKKFSGVMSDLYLIELNHSKSELVIFEDETSNLIPKNLFLQLKNEIFVNLDKQDVNILEKVEKLKVYDLSESIFGLGVVTGNNQSKFVNSSAPGAEPIYTGKEVVKYFLNSPSNFLVFDRENLQQVAPDEIYRAKKKLVYKTISKTLKVALDSTGSLTSNSANIIISRIPGMSQETILAFLNSDFYSYLHFKLFGGVNKIAKENLMALPFPKITVEQDSYLTSLVNSITLPGFMDKIESFIQRDIYGLTEIESKYIQVVVAAI